MTESKREDGRVRHKKMGWSKPRIFISSLLIILSIVFSIYIIYPLTQGEYEPKYFAGLFFVLLHFFYIFSIVTVKRRRQFVFWMISFLLLDSITFIFVFYEDIIV
ncbi:hypothetical protein CWI39_2825p0010 [Hamiltosporidium magnivora]|uniref:Uncharacterized protein n=1 Tax=Hamiltosporidium magnivora TaxID=148818 RepID=A0A4Q9KSK6_9MICR|nr:hypothetical protein CWI39_2825p0010 [Hamiltosporidium magnivora]